MGYDKQSFSGNVTAGEAAVMFCDKLKTAAQEISELVFVEDTESGSVFTILGIYTLTVQSNSTSAITVKIEKGASVIGNQTLNVGSATPRGAGYILATNANAAAFLTYNSSSKNTAAFILTKSGASWYNYAASTDVSIPGTKLWFDESTMVESYSSAVRLPYTVAGTDVEIIEGLALITSNQKSIDVQGLCDSSMVTAKTRFNLDGEAYFAINENIVIKM